jgi:diamine N-acetyltransferase
MIVLRAITKDNWEDAARLSVRNDQIDFVMPNAWAIAEAKFYDALKPTAIYDGGTMVGFLAYGRNPHDDKCWLFRFMIDANHQRKGYGRAALLRLFDLLRKTTDCTELNVGYDPNNTVAERLYLSVGFEKTGVAPWGELTARVDLTGNP